MKRHALLIGLGLALVLVFLGRAAKLYQISFIQQLDNILYDYRLRFTMPRGERNGFAAAGLHVEFAGKDESSGFILL